MSSQVIQTMFGGVSAAWALAAKNSTNVARKKHAETGRRLMRQQCMIDSESDVFDRQSD
jgi:hypothetical protein